MRNGFLGSMAVLFVSTGLALAQQYPLYQPVGYYPAGPVIPANAGWPMANPGYYMPVDAATPPAVDTGCGSGCCGPVCSPPCCPACPPCEKESCCNIKPFHECGWVSADYLLWRIQDGPLPLPLLTTSNVTNPAFFGPNNPPRGAIGGAGTQVLIGNQNFDYDAFAGARLTAGFWFDPSVQACGMDFSGFFLPRRSSSFGQNSNGQGSPFLAIPYLNPPVGVGSSPGSSDDPNTEQAFVIANDNLLAGGMNVTSTSKMYGAEANLLGVLYRSTICRFTVIQGFRYVQLNEDINMITRITPIADGAINFAGSGFGADRIPGGSSITVRDFFGTRNSFYGGQLGGRWEVVGDRFWLDVTGKAGIGLMREVLTVNGFSTLVRNEVGAQPINAPGGFFAVSGNSGTFKENEFAGLLDGQIRAGMEVGYGVSAWVGYNILFITDLARPGQQINRVVDISQVPVAAPINTFSTFVGAPNTHPIDQTSFYVHGLSLGLQVRF